MENNVKKVEATTVKKATNEILKKLAEQLQEQKFIERSINVERKKIYKFQLDSSLSTIEQKRLRSKLRKERDLLAFKVAVANKNFHLSQKIENVETVKKFIEFVRNNYILQNFEFESIATKISNKSDELNLRFTLELCKLYLSSNNSTK
jgi:hypothetical protein